MLPRSARTITLPCVQCGRAATEIVLMLGQATSPDSLARRDRLERTDFMGSLIRYGNFAELAQLFQAIVLSDYVAARAVDADFVAYQCAACGQVYCDTCWQLHPPEFDEGFYDHTRATCPAGHEQMVDD
jgi:hypothetical protein